MSKKKVSHKLQQGCEKYLASLGSSRDQLTEIQWEVLVNNVGVEQTFRWAIPFFILPFALFHICLTVWSVHRTNELVNLAVPNEAVYVSKTKGGLSTLLAPDQIKTYLVQLKKSSFNTCAGLVNSILFSMIVIFRFVLRKHRLKVIEAVIVRKQDLKTNFKGNPPPLKQ